MTADSDTSPQNISQDEVVTKISGLYNLIGERLESLPEQLNVAKGEEKDSDSDDSVIEESHASPNSEDRKADVQDILSVFDHTTLPEDLGIDFLGDTPLTAGNEELFVPGSLAATIYGIAMYDEAFHQRLRRVVTRKICARSYFSKQRARAREAMFNLDRYIENGPSELAEFGIFDVPICARTLRVIVDQICKARDARASLEPLGAATIKNLAEILVDILTEVVFNRNEDVYENISWERDVVNEHRRDRNLYTYLIGSRPVFDPSAPQGMSDNFVIDQLRRFPVMEWSHLLERLTTILDHIHDNTPDGERGSIAYAEELENMLQEYTREFFEPSSSSVQRRRPTPTSPPSSQKRRVE